MGLAKTKYVLLGVNNKSAVGSAALKLFVPFIVSFAQSKSLVSLCF